MTARAGKLSIVTTHFAEFGWIRLLLDNLRLYTNDSDVWEILVVNQDRSPESYKAIASLHPKLRVVEYPRSEAHFRVMGHDHPAVLNRVMSEVQGDYVCLFDSDAHPIRPGWLEVCNKVLEDFEAIVAECPSRPGYSHPCFMLFPARFRELPLSFDAKLFSDKVDTGRLIGRQLAQAGAGVYFAAGAPSFGGLWGRMYLDCVYHHANGSFSGGDARLKSQLCWQHAFFTGVVQRHHRYALTFAELLRYKTMCKWRSCARRVVGSSKAK